MRFTTRSRKQPAMLSAKPIPATKPLRRTRTVVGLMAALALGGLIFGGTGAQAASAILNVFITNDTAHPVPVRGVGTQAVTGSVTVGNLPATQPVSGSVKTTSEDYTQTLYEGTLCGEDRPQGNADPIDTSKVDDVSVVVKSVTAGINRMFISAKAGDVDATIDGFDVPTGASVYRHYQTVGPWINLFCGNGSNASELSVAVYGHN